MLKVLNPEVQRASSFLVYRHRFLGLYVIFGALSLVMEIVCFRALQYFQVPTSLSIVLGLSVGILFAFWTNVRFNFKVPLAKRNRALVYFCAISAGSASLNFFFKKQLMEFGWSYEQARFVVAGALFGLAYVLHRRLSFVDRKQVGVAVYANGVEDIRAIRNKIGDFADFIHVDLIDATFSAPDTDVRSYRLETIQAYWPGKKVHVHLMSRQPSRWLQDVLAYGDVFIVHAECDENLDEILAMIRNAGKQAGLALTLDTPLEAAQPLLDRISVLMLLTIKQPGRSGQVFQIDALHRIEQINLWSNRKKFALCVDGGVCETNIHLLNVELVVSGSSVLQAGNPVRQIMRLQTSSNYEAV